MVSLPSRHSARRRACFALALSLVFALPAWAQRNDGAGMVGREVQEEKEEHGASGVERAGTKAPAPPAGKATETTPPAGNVVVPLVMYTPETHVGIGAFYVHFFRFSTTKESRVSSLAAVALVTTRRQAIFEIHPDFYWANDAGHAFGKLEYQRYPDSFWGIGNKTNDADEERYTRDRIRFRGGPNYRVVGPLYAGVGVDIMEYTARYSDPNGVFARQNIPGEGGGFTAGLGPVASYDTRDNAVSTRTGWLLNATVQWFGAPISRYDFRKFIFEARRFFQISGDHVIGTRFYGETQGGSVPYYHLAMLGGDELLRGYYLGRWRDKNLAALEVEYRYPLIWRFGGVAFAGAGEVADKVTDLTSVPIRWALGGGLRFSLNDDEHLNLRLDAGFGPHTYGFYFTAREAF